jgi:hypothetical protein
MQTQTAPTGTATPAPAPKPKAKPDAKTARAVAAVKADRKAAKAAKDAPARPVARAVTDALGGAATRTFAIRITTAELDAIHGAAGTRGACRFAREAMQAFAAHDGKAFAKVIKAAKANGGSAQRITVKVGAR